MSKRSLEINDLVVANFRTENMPKDVAQWRITNHIPYAESCARQIWYGDSTVFHSFPVENMQNHACTLYHGMDAYKFLLKLNLGLLSHRQGETNVTGQFYKGWESMNADLPQFADYYRRLVEHITADTRLVRGQILSGFKTQRAELCARDLSGFKKGDQVLILGDVLDNGSISCLTDGLVRVLSSNGQKAGEIALTHPDPCVLDKMFTHFNVLKAQGKIIPHITRVSFEDLPLAVELYDQLYITHSMDVDPALDFQIQSVWQGSPRQDNTLTHMKGDPQNRGLSSETWTKTFLDNYTSPEDIRGEMIKRSENNQRVVMRAGIAIDVITDMRIKGVQPSVRLINEQSPNLISKLRDDLEGGHAGQDPALQPF